MSSTTNGFRNNRVLQSRGKKKTGDTQNQSSTTVPSSANVGRKAARRTTALENISEISTRSQAPRQAPSVTVPKSSRKKKQNTDEIKSTKRNPFSGNTSSVSKQSRRPVTQDIYRTNTSKSVPLTALEFKKISIG